MLVVDSEHSPHDGRNPVGASGVHAVRLGDTRASRIWCWEYYVVQKEQKPPLHDSHVAMNVSGIRTGESLSSSAEVYSCTASGE